MALIERHKEKRFGFRVRIQVNVTQVHLKDVEWLLDLTEIGRLRFSVRCYQWIVTDQKAVKWLLELLQPYFHTKENQVKIALQILNIEINSMKSLQYAARLADKLASFNVRSKNRRKNFATAIKKVSPVTTDSKEETLLYAG